jgi:hypothetical protein
MFEWFDGARPSGRLRIGAPGNYRTPAHSRFLRGMKAAPRAPVAPPTILAFRSVSVA